MKNRWVLICDASRARIFRDEKGESGGQRFALLETLEHEASRAKASDLVADAYGRKPVGPSVGGSYGGRSVSLGHGRVGAEPDTDPKEVEAQKFAQELSGKLEAALNRHEFEALVVVAPPKFLGLLRDTFGAEVGKRIEATVNKDLAKFDAREVEERVRAELAA